MDPENVGTDAIVRVTHWLRGIWEMRRRTGPVQQWVDSIPSYVNTTSIPPENLTEVADQSRESGASPTPKTNGRLRANHTSEKLDMTASAPISIPNSPAITTGLTSSTPLTRLVRDPSFQSDSSHCSSVESLLEWRKADPEAILLGLGFGYPSTTQENGSLSRIPRRFLQPSKLKGIAINDFLKQQQESSESLDSASLGYRGLTGSPYVAPSEIVQKIMERLREHESHDSDTCPTTNSQGDQFSPMQQEGRLSVLSPNNRQYLERPRSKSPDMRNKRMIIGEKSFAFGYDGDLIEIQSSTAENTTAETNSNCFNFNFNPSIVEPGTDTSINSRLGNDDVQNNYMTSEQILPAQDRKLAKQFSFDEDLSSQYLTHSRFAFEKPEHAMKPECREAAERKDSDDYGDSLITVISRESSNQYTTKDSNESLPRRASDGLCSRESRGEISRGTDERRMSDTALWTEMQKLRKNNNTGKEFNDIPYKRRTFKRQARVNDSNDSQSHCNVNTCGDADCKNSVNSNQAVFQDSGVVEHRLNVCATDETEHQYDVERNSESQKNRIVGESSGLHTQMSDRQVAINEEQLSAESTLLSNNKLCCLKNKDLCCTNDKLDQICEHDETCMDCCYNANATNCWRNVAKMMKKNRKLEDMVKKNTQEMAELREMMNSVLSVRMEPGF